MKTLSSIALLAASSLIGCGEGATPPAPADPAQDAGSHSGASGGALGLGGSPSADTDSLTGPTAGGARYLACVEYIETQCKKLNYECMGAPPPEAERCSPWSATCPDFLLGPGSAWTPDGLRACAQAWRTLPCEELIAGIRPVCANPPGMGDTGTLCLHQSQCASQSCSSNGRSCGECVAPANLGQPCALEPCGPGLVCGATSAQCEAAPPPRLKTPLGGACTADGDCSLGAHCSSAPDDPRLLCRWPHPVGGPCTTDDHCQPDAVCGATSTCIAAPTLGQACSEASPRCSGGTTCYEDNIDGPICVHVRDADIGKRCVVASYPFLFHTSGCARGLMCFSSSFDELEGRCVLRRLVGEACGEDFNVVCEQGTTCVDGACAPSGDQHLVEQMCSSPALGT